MIVACATLETGLVAVVKLPLEERIDERIEAQEGSGGQRVVSAREAGLSELSNPQLLDLFELRRDAVGE